METTSQPQPPIGLSTCPKHGTGAVLGSDGQKSPWWNVKEPHKAPEPLSEYHHNPIQALVFLSQLDASEWSVSLSPSAAFLAACLIGPPYSEAE